MHIDDLDSDLLKAWVVKRLEDVSDADSDVLADYVLALVKSDESDDQVKQNCQENLEDFLKDNTASFVNDVFAAIATKSYDPSRPAPKALQPTAPAFNPPSAPIGAVAQQNYQQTGFGGNDRWQQGRKRQFQDDGTDGQNSNGYGRGDRPMKQMRRGGRGGYDQRGGRNAQAMPQMPTPPPGMPAFDPNNPIAALLAMQAMMPGMPSLTDFAQQTGSQPPRQPGKRCRDYDTKGFCALGASCPYDHGNDHVVVSQQADEYDPMNPTSTRNGGEAQGRTYERGRGRGRGRGDRGAFRGGRGGRADFSSTAPNYDKSITSLVVEQIPEDKFDEQSIRDFFSEFGTIENVELQDYKRLAIIKYTDYDSAAKARDSPRAIFDNRFVKVYWYKLDKLPRPSDGYQNEHSHRALPKPTGDEDVDMSAPPVEASEEKIDPVEFAKKQEEAQRAHEEKTRKIKEAEAARADLEQKLKAQAEERSKLLAKLAAKERAKSGTPDVKTAAANGDGQKSSQTDALKAKLAELEKEAESMGINPNEESWQGFPARGGRGGFRGRGGYQPRGGAWRGGSRGGFAPRGGAVMRLDNRPKNIAVVFPEGSQMGPDKDEALRQYLLFNDMMESAEVNAHPDRKDAAVLAFRERYLAEKFLAMAKDIPHIGKVELSWVANSAVPAPSSAGAAFAAAGNGEVKDVGMEEAGEYVGNGGGRQEVDYDVADDDEDRWLIE